MVKHATFPHPAWTFTDGAMQLLKETVTNPLELLERHRHGDWGYGRSIQEHITENAAGAQVPAVSKFCLGDPPDWKRRIVLYTDVNRRLTTMMTVREFLEGREQYPL